MSTQTFQTSRGINHKSGVKSNVSLPHSITQHHAEDMRLYIAATRRRWCSVLQTLITTYSPGEKKRYLFSRLQRGADDAHGGK